MIVGNSPYLTAYIQPHAEDLLSSLRSLVFCYTQRLEDKATEFSVEAQIAIADSEYEVQLVKRTPKSCKKFGNYQPRSRHSGDAPPQINIPVIHSYNTNIRCDALQYVHLLRHCCCCSCLMSCICSTMVCHCLLRPYVVLPCFVSRRPGGPRYTRTAMPSKYCRIWL